MGTLSSLGFVDLGGRLNGRRLRKTINPLILQKTPEAEERTGAKSPTFLNAQASGVFTCALLRGIFPPRRPFFLFAGLLQSWRRLPRRKRTLNDPSMVWSLDESLTQRERWLSLRNPPD